MIKLITYLPRVESQYYTLPQEQVIIDCEKIENVLFYIKSLYELQGELTIEVKGE